MYQNLKLDNQSPPHWLRLPLLLPPTIPVHEPVQQSDASIPELPRHNLFLATAYTWMCEQHMLSVYVGTALNLHWSHWREKSTEDPEEPFRKVCGTYIPCQEPRGQGRRISRKGCWTLRRISSEEMVQILYFLLRGHHCPWRRENTSGIRSQNPESKCLGRAGGGEWVQMK